MIKFKPRVFSANPLLAEKVLTQDLDITGCCIRVAVDSMGNCKFLSPCELKADSLVFTNVNFWDNTYEEKMAGKLLIISRFHDAEHIYESLNSIFNETRTSSYPHAYLISLGELRINNINKDSVEFCVLK